jgi:hypothetical protein
LPRYRRKSWIRIHLRRQMVDSKSFGASLTGFNAREDILVDRPQPVV